METSKANALELRLVERMKDLIIDMQLANGDTDTRTRELSLAITEAEYTLFRLQRWEAEMSEG